MLTLLPFVTRLTLSVFVSPELPFWATGVILRLIVGVAAKIWVNPIIIIIRPKKDAKAVGVLLASSRDQFLCFGRLDFFI